MPCNLAEELSTVGFGRGKRCYQTPRAAFSAWSCCFIKPDQPAPHIGVLRRALPARQSSSLAHIPVILAEGRRAPAGAGQEPRAAAALRRRQGKQPRLGKPGDGSFSTCTFPFLRTRVAFLGAVLQTQRLRSRSFQSERGARKQSPNIQKLDCLQVNVPD